jgi:hypothetical protein
MAKRTNNETVRLSGDKLKIVVIGQDGKCVALRYRAYIDGRGKVRRVLSGPILPSKQQRS